MNPDDAAKHLLQNVEAKTGKVISNSRLIDIGCGTRFGVGIRNHKIPIKYYCGIDIDRELISWMQENIATDCLHFVHWPVQNPEYNPDGADITEMTELPVEGLFDVATFFSVFTHLNPDDSSHLLRLTRRVLTRNGCVFLTAFVKPDIDVYQEGNPDRPSLISLHPKKSFEKLVRGAGFEIVANFLPEPLMAHQYVLRLA
jgi:SAM-dependent methyltransferase